ncbi:MAG: DNA polymerase III subunit delta' [Firmicutes bacterium]|nr:DNA polymerase III subunit delta' [Bacillota bacterium]
MGWEKLENQPAVSKLLQNSLAQGRVAHAYLFSGPDLNGKKVAARLLAQAVNCDRGRPCGSCPSCNLITAGSHPDVELIEPEGRFLRLHQIKALCHRAGTTTLVGRTKVYILQETEKLLPEGANHLLKTLEEPPADTIFILFVQHKQVLLPTIVSRCQQIDFQPLPPAVIVKRLQAAGCNPERAHLAAYLAAGDLATAQKWTEAEAVTRKEQFLQLVRKLPQGKNIPFEAAECFAESPEYFLPLLQAWYRDLLVWHAGGRQEVYHRGQEKAIADQASLYSYRKLVSCNRIIDETSRLILGPHNVNVRLALEALLVQLIPAAK